MSLGVPVKGLTTLCWDSFGIIIFCTNPDSELKNKHMEITYHKLRESAATGYVNPIKFCTMANQSDILTKSTSVGTLCSLSDASYGFHWVEV